MYHIERFMRRFPHFTLAVSIGTVSRDSLLFIKKFNGKNNFRLFQPNVANHVKYVRAAIDKIHNNEFF